MYTNDFITRMLQALAQKLAKVSGMKSLGMYEEALALTGEGLRSLLGMNPKVADWFSHKDMMKMLSPGETENSAGWIMLAHLLKEEGEILALQNKEQPSFNRFIKSLNIYLECLLLDEIDLDSKMEEEIEDQIESIVEQTRMFNYPAETLLLMFALQERRENYAEAEDILFELLEIQAEPAVKAQWVQTGSAFYHRLLEKTRSQLQSGGLPREEVLQGLKELDHY